MSQIAGDLKLGEGSSEVGVSVAVEELELELDGRRPGWGFQLPQVSKKPGSRQLVRMLYPYFNLSDCR